MSEHYTGAPGGYTSKGDWVTATAYLAKDHVENDSKTYVCSLAHTSAATSEPGTGATWATYWTLTSIVIDDIRLEIRDTDATRYQFTDEELLYLYYQREDEKLYDAAAHACEILAARYAREADFKDGEISIKLSNLAKNYADHATSLRKRQLEEEEQEAGQAVAVRPSDDTRDPLFTIDRWTYGEDRKVTDEAD